MSNSKRAKKGRPSAKKTATPVKSAAMPAKKTAELAKGVSRWLATERARRWRYWALLAAEALSLVALFLFMLSVSWQRWSDPLIDFPKNLYLAWRISEGDLLYQQVTNWYGPLAHLVEAAGFRVFGVGIDTIVGMNIVLTLIVVLLVRGIFGALGNRLMGWLSAVVFIPLFAFGHFTETANYNFITPYASQATYSFLGLLLVLWGLLRHLKSERWIWLGVAGLGFGLAYLDKPEAMLAAGAALGIYLSARIVRVARQSPPDGGRRAAAQWLGRAAGWLLGGFLGAWLPVFLYFWSRGGFAYAWRATDFAPLTLLNGSIRQAVENSPMMQRFFGFDHPWQNFFQQAGAGALMLALCGLMMVTSWRATRAKRFGGGWWMWVALLVLATVAGGVLAHRANYWLGVGRAIVFPVFLATAGMVAWSAWLAWRGGAAFARALGLAVVGVAASLMLGRMVLNANISHYGFFMMPLAMLFWIHGVAGEAARPRAGDARANRLLPAVVMLLVLVGVAECMFVECRVYSAQTMEVGSGRDRLYTLPFRVTPTGTIFNTMLKAFRENAPKAKTLVAFPEGIAVNYHLRVPTTLAEMEFHPTALGYVGPEKVLAELQAHPPEAIFVFLRDYYEFGDKYFGQSEASGRSIMLWVQEKYFIKTKWGRSFYTFTQDTVDLYAPRTPPAGGAPTPSTPPAQGGAPLMLGPLH